MRKVEVYLGVLKGESGILAVDTLNFLKCRYEFIQNLGRNHDAVAIGTNFLSDAYHSSPRIFFQVDEEGFAIYGNLFCANNIVIHGYLCTGVIVSTL